MWRGGVRQPTPKGSRPLDKGQDLAAWGPPPAPPARPLLRTCAHTSSSGLGLTPMSRRLRTQRMSLARQANLRVSAAWRSRSEGGGGVWVDACARLGMMRLVVLRAHWGGGGGGRADNSQRHGQLLLQAQQVWESHQAVRAARFGALDPDTAVPLNRLAV